MSGAGPRVLCPTCGQVVDVTDPATVKAFEQVPTGTFGDPADNTDQSDGMGAAFHPGCYRENDPRYERAD